MHDGSNHVSRQETLPLLASGGGESRSDRFHAFEAVRIGLGQTHERAEFIPRHGETICPQNHHNVFRYEPNGRELPSAPP
jgi:hypothetical protein